MSKDYSVLKWKHDLIIPHTGKGWCTLNLL